MTDESKRWEQRCRGLVEALEEVVYRVAKRKPQDLVAIVLALAAFRASADDAPERKAD